MRLAHEHILDARRRPDQRVEIALGLGVSQEAALALAIADHLCEEFDLAPR